MSIHMDLVYSFLIAVSVSVFIHLTDTCTNNVPGTGLVSEDTSMKETMYEHSMIYFILPPFTNSRFAMIRNASANVLLLQMLL